MKINVLTLFPEMFTALDYSVVGKARENEIVNLNLINFRDFAKNIHHSVDDAPYGGGPGMVLQVQPIADALASIKQPGRVIITAPQGKPFKQEVAREWSKEDNLTFLCGHYEGFDQRIYDMATDVVSIGDFVLTGGELPTMAMIDATTRLLPGVLGNETSADDESFSDGLLEYPQYSRPANYHGQEVPPVLISGDHAKIAAWRERESLKQTLLHRPDLLAQKQLTRAQEIILSDIKIELADELASTD